MCNSFDKGLCSVADQISSMNNNSTFSHEQNRFAIVLNLSLLCSAVVLFPGGRLPLRVTTRERLAVEKALAADPPLERLLVIVLSPHRDAGSHCNVGCTAEIRQMRRHSDGVISLVAKGLQRVKVQLLCSMNRDS